MSAVVLTAGTVATSALAAGEDSRQAAAVPAAAISDRADLPPRTALRPPSPQPRTHQRTASRQHSRSALVGSPRDIARVLVARQGWSASQFGCLDQLWTRESDWQVSAQNSSGAYGIPQALPASKMATVGADWRTNPITQIRWGLSYIANAYGSPCVALQHSYRYNYY